MSDEIRTKVMPMAPTGMTQLCITDGSMTEANEAAILNAMKSFADKNNIQDWTQMNVLGFDNGYHGTTAATLSVSNQGVIDIGVPLCGWKRIPFPRMKYPMSENETENKAAEDRALKAVTEVLAEGNTAAVIIEPVSLLGNEMATPLFYKALRKITKERGVCLIVDETKTGMGSTCRFWGHEHWYLDESPDIVTFGGKAGLAGYFAHFDYGCNVVQGEFDHSKIDHFDTTWRYIQDWSLLEMVSDTSAFLKLELGRISRE